jgi:hypothetical protein
VTAFDEVGAAPLDEKAVIFWLRKASRNEILAIVARGVLRAFPLVPHHVASRLTLILAILRLSSTGLFAIKYQRNFAKKAIWHVCDIIEEITSTAVAPTAQAASLIGSVLFGKDDEAARMAAKAIELLLAFDEAKASSIARRDTLDALRRDIIALESGFSSEQLILMPLWPETLPKWFDKIWKDLSSELRKRAAHWEVWILWYNRVLIGSTAATASSRSFDEAFVDVRRAKALPWDEGPKAVNDEITTRLAILVANSKGGSPFATRPTSGKETLDQRPSSYRFDWREDQIEATPVIEPPFDQILASALAQEILAKAQQALFGLSDNNADELVRRSMSAWLS